MGSSCRFCPAHVGGSETCCCSADHGDKIVQEAEDRSFSGRSGSPETQLYLPIRPLPRRPSAALSRRWKERRKLRRRHRRIKIARGRQTAGMMLSASSFTTSDDPPHPLSPHLVLCTLHSVQEVLRETPQCALQILCKMQIISCSDVTVFKKPIQNRKFN